MRNDARPAPSRARTCATVALALLPLVGACDSIRADPAPRLQLTWGELSVPPGEVIFRNATPRTDVYEERVVLRNVGSAPLRITRIALDGDDHFTLSDDSPTSAALQPSGQTEVFVHYKSTDLQLRRTSLVVESNDGFNPRLRAGVRNDDVQARIVVTDCVRSSSGGNCIPPTDDLLVDFGDVNPGECRSGVVIVENASKADLAVQQPSFEPGSSSEISFDGPGVGDFSLGPVDDQGITQRQEIGVKYCPGQSTTASARMILRSNDPANPELEVDFTGRPIIIGDVHCDCGPSPIEVAPQDTIALSANCTDSQGSPLQYRWTVERRPSGSTEPIQNANSRNASFTANTATTPTEPYVFRVVATNTGNHSGTCTVTAFATPTNAIHLQLVWDTDVTDLDLHFLNPAGSAAPHGPNGFFSIPNDNFYMNVYPDWGVVSRTDDNPRLDLDDVNGYGPENINLAHPASGTYTVGVHYFCDDGRGASRATVRVFCNGNLARQYGPQSLRGTGAFWDVARLDWPGCNLSPIGTTTTVTQGCLGF